jgi:hypothetical protein
MGEQMRAFFSKMKHRLSRGFPKREVRFDDVGFSVFEEEKMKSSLRWSDTVEVFAYKIDLFSIDEICIGFRVDSAGTHHWVSEEFTGYHEFLEELSRRFPGIRTDWFSAVALPAFVENRTTLWGAPWTHSSPMPIQRITDTTGRRRRV